MVWAHKHPPRSYVIRRLTAHMGSAKCVVWGGVLCTYCDEFAFANDVRIWVNICTTLFTCNTHSRTSTRQHPQVNLTSTCPCIANIFSEYNQQDETYLKFTYSCKTFYMFQTGFPSIIRSTKLHIQRQVFVAWRLAAGSSICLTPYVQFCAPDDGRKNPSETCRASYRNK